MPSLDLIFTLLMLPAVCLLGVSIVVSMLESKHEQNINEKRVVCHE
jgi:hypothetical protein